MGAETRVDNELAKFRGFSEGNRKGFGKKVGPRLMDPRRGSVWDGEGRPLALWYF